MRLVFLGTPEFAVPSLERCLEAGHDIKGVFTQPDRPKGRGQALAFSPVKEAALRHGVPVFQPRRIREPDVVKQLAELDADVMVVVGYGQIIPQAVIDLPRFGIINVHASLLPKYRGAAPIQWTIARGEQVTGVTTMQIDAGLDTGDILLQQESAIGPEETAPELSRRLAALCAALLAETLRRAEEGTLEPRRQDPALATYAPILKKEDGLIEWTQPAAEVVNRCRGFLPWPGCYTTFRGQLLHIGKARAREGAMEAPPGALLPGKRELLVACGDGTLVELLEVQPEGRKVIPAQAFLNGYRPGHRELLGQ